jgi:hypothetical protein
MHKGEVVGDVVAEDGSSSLVPVLNDPLRSPRPRDVDVVTFLQTALKSGMVTVPELEILARAAGLLGDQQRISQGKQFKRAKITLGIQSIRQGFGPGGGWAWVLPPPANAPASETKPKEPVIRAEPERGAIYGDGIVGAAPRGSLIDDVEIPREFRDVVGVPSSWLKGVACLNDQHRPRDVPPHRWHQFVGDCYRFIVSAEGWAQRAANLGWDTLSLFGCNRSNPLMHLGRAGLLLVVGGGRIIRLHRDWAEIQPPANGSRRTYHRRRVDPSVVTVPWLR